MLNKTILRRLMVAVIPVLWSAYRAYKRDKRRARRV